MSATQALQKWFNELSDSQQQEVLEMLYGNLLVKQGAYLGLDPRLAIKGLHGGSLPITSQVSQSSACPKCGRPY